MNSSMLLFFFSLVLLILQCNFVEPITWQSGGWAFGCDFTNNDLSNVQISGSECGGKCAATSGCTHFTWSSYQGGTCWMKSGSVSQSDAFDVSDQSVVCGIVDSSSSSSSSIKWQSGGWAFGCDFTNNDLFNVQIASSQCGGKCAATSGCTHFTWSSYQGGTCWMKYGSVSQSNAFPVSDQSVVCGIVGSSSSSSSSIKWQSGGWAFGCDFTNNDLFNVQIASSQCGGKCAATSGCTHFTWSSYQGGTCWMKYGSVSQSNAFSVSDQSVVCGIISNSGKLIKMNFM